jgi:uncharacterized membrane protein SirB2
MIRWTGSTCCHERHCIHHRGRNIDYALLKLIHVCCVAISYTFFVLRGLWMLVESPRLGQRWVKIAPHLVDSALLASAIAMAVTMRQYPLMAGWLTAKVVALAVYIGLGMIALKSGSTRSLRFTAWLAAQAVFFYIVGVALTRDPLPWRSIQ